MKQHLKLSTALLAFVLIGCAGIQPGNDPVVVNAERSTSVAVDTFDSLFRVEAANHELLKANAPQVVAGVNLLRRNAPHWISSVRALTVAYKSNRSAQNKANLETALSVLEAGISQARTYLSQIGA